MQKVPTDDISVNFVDGIIFAEDLILEMFFVF
jgi:hypothetical protein